MKGEKCSLESLHLANNKCSDYGAKAIAQALAVNKSLIHLDMTYNDINDFGLTLFAQSLTQNSTLMSFKIFGNHFGQQFLKLFCGLFESERENPWFPVRAWLLSYSGPRRDRKGGNPFQKRITFSHGKSKTRCNHHLDHQ